MTTSSPSLRRKGLIDSYIHTHHTRGQVGVLVEVNCETDEVARLEEFQTLVRNIALQIAACPHVEYVKLEDIPADVVQKEKDIEMCRDDMVGKPENIKEKIVQGRIEEHLKHMTLTAQPYIKDQTITVAELLRGASATLGENILIRRFARYAMELGPNDSGERGSGPRTSP